MFSIDVIQDDIMDYVQGNMTSPLVEQAIPDSVSVKRDSQGRIKTYIALQFGDEQEGGARSMIGPRGDDYIMPVYFQVISPDPTTARKTANKLKDVLLGYSPEWAGAIRKRAGGGMFPLIASTGATEAFMFPASFGVVIQISNEA